MASKSTTRTGKTGLPRVAGGFYPSSDQKKSASSPKAAQPVTSKGTPKLQQTGIPGYDMGTGTPAYIAKAAKHAEGLADSNRGSAHRIPAGGAAPERGKAYPKVSDKDSKQHQSH